MKNRILAVFLIALVVASLFGCSDNSPQYEKDTPTFANSEDMGTLELELMAYSYAVSTFSEVTVEEIENKKRNDDEFFLYVGRATCEWCRKVAPVLSQVSEEKNVDIYYLDSTNTESNESIKNFRINHDVKTVPTILKFSGNGIYSILEYDLSQSRSDLVGVLSDLLQ